MWSLKRNFSASYLLTHQSGELANLAMSIRLQDEFLMLLLYKTVACYVASFRCLRYGGITVQMGSVDCNWAVTNTALHIVTNSIAAVNVKLSHLIQAPLKFKAKL